MSHKATQDLPARAVDSEYEAVEKVKVREATTLVVTCEETVPLCGVVWYVTTEVVDSPSE